MSEYIVEIPDYVPPFDPAVRTASFGEQIVRCRDCRFFEETGNCTWFECGTCGTQGEVTENGFCAWGERRDA